MTLAHPAALRGVLAAGFYLAGIAAAAVPQSPVFTRLALAACGEGLLVGLAVDVGVLGCCETGVFAGNQAELDELAMFDDVVEPVGGDSQPVGGQGVQMVAAGDGVGEGPDNGTCGGWRLPASRRRQSRSGPRPGAGITGPLRLAESGGQCPSECDRDPIPSRYGSYRRGRTIGSWHRAACALCTSPGTSTAASISAQPRPGRQRHAG